MSIYKPQKWKSSYKNDFYSHPILKYFMFWKMSRVYKLIPESNELVIDLGSGFGYMLLSLIQKSNKVYGIDQNTKLDKSTNMPFARTDDWLKKYPDLFSVTKDLIETEVPFQKEKIKLIEAKAWELGVNDGVVDVVCALDIFEHIEEQKRTSVKNEINRVLKKNGILIYSVPNTIGFAFKLRSILALLFGRKEDPDTFDHKNYNWKKDLDAFSKVFEIKKISHFPIYLLGIEPSIIVVCQKKQ